MGALRLGAAAAAVGVVAAVGVLLLAHGGAAPAAEPTQPVGARASFDRSAAQFGDALTARIDVVLDRDAVKPDTLKVTRDLAPLTILSSPSTARTVSGRVETVSITQRVACLTAPCLARRIVLPRVQVAVTGRDGSPVTASVGWKRLPLGSRVAAADLEAADPRFAADTAPARPSYLLSPST